MFFKKLLKKNTKNTPFSKDETFKDYCTYLQSPNRVFWINFIAGTGRGLGFLMGATMVFIILAFVLGRVLSEMPIVGNFFTWLDLWLRENITAYGSVRTYP